MGTCSASGPPWRPGGPSWRHNTNHHRVRGCGGGDGLERNEVCGWLSGPTNLRTHTCNSTHLCVQLPRVGGERWSAPKSPTSGPCTRAQPPVFTPARGPARRSRLSSRARLQRRSVASRARLHTRYFTRAQPITPITCTCFFRGHGEGVAHRLFRMSPAQWLRGPRGPPTSTCTISPSTTQSKYTWFRILHNNWGFSWT